LPECKGGSFGIERAFECGRQKIGPGFGNGKQTKQGDEVEKRNAKCMKMKMKDE